MNKIALSLLICLLPTASFAAEDGPTVETALSAVSGLWLTASGTAQVEISDCGDGTPCGTMVSVTPPQGGEAIDGYNPDPELKGRPLVGVQMLWGFKEKSGRWKSGKIYNAENGKTYKSKIKRLEDGTLEVKGCVGPICQGQIWTPVTNP